jgi:uncharacterized protein (TIGR03083 family)
VSDRPWQLDAIAFEGSRFWGAIEQADDLDAPVPSCPDWSIRDLAGHLIDVDWFWTTIVERPITDPTRLGDMESDRPQRPVERAPLVALGRSTTGRMVDVFGATDPQREVWTWSSQHDAAFVSRHQVQETAVHRWDAQTAVGAELDAIEPRAASDAIDEYLNLGRPFFAANSAPPPGSVHLHCTDVEGEWIVQPDGQVEPIHAKGDVALRGTASDLLLTLYNRLPLDALDVIGDRTVAEAFLGIRMP